MLKTLLVVTGLALTSPVAFAQTTPAAKASQYEHCILVFGDGNFGVKGLWLDFGQYVKEAPPKPELIKASTTVGKMTSVIPALDYMSSQGWECINVNTTTDSNAKPATSYLLRRAK